MIMLLIHALRVNVEEFRRLVQSLPLEELGDLYDQFFDENNERGDDGYADRQLIVRQTLQDRTISETGEPAFEPGNHRESAPIIPAL
jgi:hypothetical protein